MKKLEADLSQSIEYQSSRIDDLKAGMEPLVKENVILKREVEKLQQQTQLNSVLINKHERFSRRNNLRIVGIATTEGENYVQIAEDVFFRHFDMHEMTVERAHRDGRGIPGRPAHILVKRLSYRDKIEVMKQAKTALKDVSFFIVDDLTKADLLEKKQTGKASERTLQQGD